MMRVSMFHPFFDPFFLRLNGYAFVYASACERFQELTAYRMRVCARASKKYVLAGDGDKGAIRSHPLAPPQSSR
jgi:hypothetical protein